MDKKEKKFSNVMTKIFYFLLIIFSVLYFSKTSGYYEISNHKKIEMTEKEIKKFEKDLKSGKNVRAKDYINEGEINYNNFASDIGYSLSNQVSNIVTNGLDGTISFLSQLLS